MVAGEGIERGAGAAWAKDGSRRASSVVVECAWDLEEPSRGVRTTWDHACSAVGEGIDRRHSRAGEAGVQRPGWSWARE
jgi:hypothetical protein